jgi:hypothetical protein
MWAFNAPRLRLVNLINKLRSANKLALGQLAVEPFRRAIHRKVA